MKIKYEFVDGDVELEVSDEWASVLAELDRLERNNDKKEKRRHYSLEACTYEGKDFMADCDLLRDLMAITNRMKKIYSKLKKRLK